MCYSAPLLPAASFCCIQRSYILQRHGSTRDGALKRMRCIVVGVRAQLAALLGGATCAWGDGRRCVSSHRAWNQQQWFLSIPVAFEQCGVQPSAVAVRANLTRPTCSSMCTHQVLYRRQATGCISSATIAAASTFRSFGCHARPPLCHIVAREAALQESLQAARRLACQSHNGSHPGTVDMIPLDA